MQTSGRVWWGPTVSTSRSSRRGPAWGAPPLGLAAHPARPDRPRTSARSRGQLGAMSEDVASRRRPVAVGPSGVPRPSSRRDATVVACTLTWVPLVLLLDRGAELWSQRRSAWAPGCCSLAAAPRDPARPRAGGGGRRLRHGRRVHVLPAARGLRLPAATTCRRSSRPATAWSTSVRWPSAGPRSCCADAPPLVVVTVAAGGGLRRRGGCWSPPGSTCSGVLVPLPARIPALGPVADALRRRLRRGDLPRAARHLAGHLGWQTQTRPAWSRSATRPRGRPAATAGSTSRRCSPPGAAPAVGRLAAGDGPAGCGAVPVRDPRRTTEGGPSSCQAIEHLVVQRAVRGHGAAAAGPGSRQVGEPAAGLLDDDVQRGQVVERPGARRRRRRHPRRRACRTRSRRRPGCASTESQVEEGLLAAATSQPPEQEKDSEASVRSVTSETASRVAADRLLPVKAPVPAAAHQRRPRAGAETTPATTSSPSIRAISVAQTGTPRTKYLVPSMGSMTHRRGP